MSDRDLVLLCQSHAADAFRELWVRHHPVVMMELRRITSFDPEEISQEAFARVLSRIADGAEVSSFRAYVIRTARNIAIDMSRKWENSHTRAAKCEEIERALGSQPDHAGRVADRELFLQTYRQLPNQYRAILWLHDAEDRPIRDCAAILKVTHANATTRLRRARTAFKQAWCERHYPRMAP